MPEAFKARDEVAGADAQAICQSQKRGERRIRIATLKSTDRREFAVHAVGKLLLREAAFAPHVLHGLAESGVIRRSGFCPAVRRH